MNKVILMGRLTKDPDVRYSQGADGNMAIARFTLAIDRKSAKKDSENAADFISCISFGKQGEFVEKYFRKGMKMVLSGRIQTGSYTNKDGNKVYTTDVVTEEVAFAESKGNNAGGTSTTAQKPSDDGFMNIPDNGELDIPFN